MIPKLSEIPEEESPMPYRCPFCEYYLECLKNRELPTDDRICKDWNPCKDEPETEADGSVCPNANNDNEPT